MYRISKWKLALIIGVFLFSGLYLLPTIPGFYGRLYGYFDMWMQDKVSPPDVQPGENGNFIRFIVPRDLPKGVSIQEASESIQDVISRRLAKLGMGTEVEGALVEGGAEQKFSFDNFTITDLYIRFDQPKSEAELQEIIGELQLGGDPPLVSQPPELLTDEENQGSIKFTITRDDVPEGKSMQEALADIQKALREQLVGQEIKDDEFGFDGVTRDELHVRFNPQRSKAELEALIEKMRLYGGLPLVLRPVFPDNPLKQGLDLKGGVHVVLELDIKKAMDMYLDTQAKEIILESLKNENPPILCKSVDKKIEKRGDNLFVMRPYVPEGSTLTQAQYIAELKGKLTALGYSPEDIEESSAEGLELTIKTSIERDIGELVDSLLGGKNPLIVTVPIRQGFQGEAREEYLKAAEQTLNKLELFDKPRLLEVKERIAVFSVQLSEESSKDLAERNIDTVMKTLENRINKFGVAESTIRRVRGRPRILIQIPEEQNPARTLAAIKSPGILEFKLVKTNPASGGPWSGGPTVPEPSPDELSPGTQVRRYEEDNSWYVLNSEAFMGGRHLKSNSATVMRGEYGTPEIVMFLNRDGQSKFSEVSSQHVGELTAILLDDVIKSVPRIKEKITTPSARITGDFTDEEADYLAKILRAGSFPAPMKSAEERIVGPTLGEEAINRGKLAFIFGITLVVVFMLVYYKWSGAIAVAALLFNFQIILGVLAGFGATLTLPGMAGLILTIGMSVDANVLIFERIREEIRTGKTIRSSIDSGYQKAFWTILDANVTTFLTAIVLYEFGTGPIKGFAVTLSIGIIASMFTALVVTREIYRWVYRKRTVTKLSI